MRVSSGKIAFGVWVFIDGDKLNEGQIVDYDVLNDKYMIDKNGMWTWHDASKVEVSDL